MLKYKYYFIRAIAQSGSASGLGPEGRGFESLSPDEFGNRYFTEVAVFFCPNLYWVNPKGCGIG